MSAHRVRNKGVSCLAAAVVMSMSSIATSAAAVGSSAASDAALAAKMNLTIKDVPSVLNGSGQPPSDVANPFGRQVVACMKATGGVATTISPDLFGIVGKPSGVDTVDVASRNFFAAGSNDGLPLAESDVVFVTSAIRATNDLAAINTTADLACLSKWFGAGFKKNVTVTVAHRSRPTYGTGNGGVHLLFVITNPDPVSKGFPHTVYVDVYCYVEVRAEITVSFSSSAKYPFSSMLQDGVVAKIMSRAKSVLG